MSSVKLFVRYVLKEAKHLEIMLCDKWSSSKLTSVHTNNYNFPQFLNKKVRFAEKEPVLVIVYNTIQYNTITFYSFLTYGPQKSLILGRQLTITA